MPVFLTFLNTRLAFGWRLYNQAVVRGITRRLHVGAVFLKRSKVNMPTNANNAGVSTAFPNLITLDGWRWFSEGFDINLLRQKGRSGKIKKCKEHRGLPYNFAGVLDMYDQQGMFSVPDSTPLIDLYKYPGQDLVQRPSLIYEDSYSAYHHFVHYRNKDIFVH